MRTLDAVVAERVMGWTWWLHTREDNSQFTMLVRPENAKHWKEEFPDAVQTDGRLPGEIDRGEAPSYSTDIAASWQVVEALAAKQIYVGNLYLLLENVWVCEFHNRAHGKNDEWRACANTPMSAICRAALMYATGMDAEQVADMIQHAKHMEETK